MKYLSADEAAKLDDALMSEEAGWSLDQLMELAGLSCATALGELAPLASKVLVLCGPGNNGGDGLVCARHLKLWGYTPVVLFPKQKLEGIYGRLVKQLQGLKVPIIDRVETFEGKGYQYIVDALFGFSFKGEIRAPFDILISQLAETKIPVLSVDAPSSWDIEAGPQQGPGQNFYPTALISLSAPKPCSENFQGRHFLGGRFLGEAFERDYELPPYQGSSQIVEL